MMVRMIAGVVAGLVVGSGITVVVMRSVNAESGTPVAVTGSPATSGAPTGDPLAPRVPGWVTVRSDRGLVFDIPPTWKPPSGDARLAVLDANSNPQAGMRFVASRQPATCSV